MQEQQPEQPKFRQKLQIAIQVAKIIDRATRQDSTPLQIEDALVKSFEQLNLSEQSFQLFKDRLEKLRQSELRARLEDIYVMGGVLVYCGILLLVLMSLGVLDIPARVAWIAFAISFPSTVGFFLLRFLKTTQSIASRWWFHSILALLAQVGVIATTAGLFFYAWHLAGWIFLLCTVLVFLAYYSYRFGIYLKPFLSIFADILKSVGQTPPSAQE